MDKILAQRTKLPPETRWWPADELHEIGSLLLRVREDAEAGETRVAADANDDGRADISDSVYTLGHLFLRGPAPPAPPAPFPAAGEDLTADGLGCES